VLDVVGIDKARVVAAGKGTAFVSGSKRSFDRGWDGTSLATNTQWLARLVFDNDNGITVTT
jgi:hypothetical protein